MTWREIHQCNGGSCTMRDGLPEAEKCRSRGWTVGTRIVGDEGYGPHTIEITAIGHEALMARRVVVGEDANGDPVERLGRESMWTLTCRCWKGTDDGDRE